MRWGETVIEDPWHEINLPTTSTDISARRVSAEDPWDFFWARDAAGRFLLIMGYAEAIGPIKTERIPNLRGVEISDVRGNAPDRRLIMLKLLDDSLRDPFQRLADDLIEGTRSANSEGDAVRKVVERLWRWHHLLRGGSSSLLSEPEQQGLIGELLLLENLLLPHFPAAYALSAWQGPLGGPKDFEVDSIAIEAKTLRKTAPPYLRISSELQLDSDGLMALYLAVVELDRAPATADDAADLSTFAARIKERLIAHDPQALELFEARLSATGFRWEDDYSEFMWVKGKTSFYLVDESFPRIVTRDLPNGTSDINYRVSLSACSKNRIDEDAITFFPTTEVAPC